MLIVVPDGAGQTKVLESGVPFNTFLEALTYANAYIDVPAGATNLTRDADKRQRRPRSVHEIRRPSGRVQLARSPERKRSFQVRGADGK
ncbi:MAG: hypothetical protein MZV70_44285 [Desulfobacterales bacterium]|nr:hypothetical protein [Desulfobacterales bacterium]